MSKHMSRGAWLVVLGLILAGANLRMPITMMPPLLNDLKAEIGLPTSLAGLLTTIPLLGFALASPLMGKFGAKHGSDKVLVVSLIILSVGSYLRVIPSSWALMVGTAILGIGIAGGNVLLPAVIKDRFPDNIAGMTTLYTMAQVIVASLGTAASGVVASKIGIQSSMAMFALVGPVALIVWIFIAVLNQRRSGSSHIAVDTSFDRPMVDRTPWRSPLAWVILAYFGMQSMLYYSLLTWLPSMWQEAGFSAVAAGNLATLFQLTGMPLTLTVPMIAEHKHGLSIINGIVGGGFALGVLGILVPGANLPLNVVAAALMGMASAAAFSICVIFFQKRTSNAADTARLSGMAQSGGYLLAAVGPVALGALNGLLHTWTPIIVLVLVVIALMFAAGIVVIRHHDIYENV
ncbi:MFS transporter [Bifidobacterium sp. ESL0704]|uniref:CynX/NimT family MFS transporter n=1 Tax=Bifidobacterium sp. ESL0704 TaxID=2983219 RepID=UPI0023F6F07D|nr:MFS transporter [Bifidobacterium sp. ESL0704]WEV52374.1 MFS transporter [Bifidobacterium sp. ESL0704]